LILCRGGEQRSLLKFRLKEKKMRLPFIVIIISITLPALSYSQDKPIKKGNIIMDTYYGFPYLYSSVLRSTYQKPGNGASIHNKNHIGGNFEIMVTDKIGLGLEATYAVAEIHYRDSNQTYSTGIDKFRVLAKMNYHFLTQKKLDPYLTLGAGYMNLYYYQTQPGINNLSENEFIRDLIPLAVRAGIGIHYFFTKHIGVNAEVGIGGPLLHGGLSFKF
jgi:hypothetical protein